MKDLKNNKALLIQSIEEIRKLKTQIKELEMRGNEQDEIAVIGMGCRFPGGADTPEKLWSIFKEEKDVVTEIPASRWDYKAYYSPDTDQKGTIYTKHGAFLDQVDQFDPLFFNISPREAEDIDPQQRLLLEVVWEALENAGIVPTQLKNSSTGVYVGIGSDDYHELSVNMENKEQVSAYSALGTSRSVAAGRISYTLGLQGPSIQLDTSCSSSLVSVNYAVEDLQKGNCDLAIAGGVNLIMSPLSTISRCQLSALSPDGRCKAFDADANGFVQGEGCGIVILKPLKKALADENNILGVIKGTAVNHGGASSGLTAPNQGAQEKVILKALEKAKLNPLDVSYVEAHGTGTSLGDPIEVAALAETYGNGRTKQDALIIGSTKTNFGHAEAAAGILSFLRALLAIQHAEIPRNLHLKKTNPFINWSEIPIQVSDHKQEWKEEIKRVGVSSFGINGTNAHVILEEHIKDVVEHNEQPDWPLFPVALSAKSKEALHNSFTRYQDYATDTEHDLKDISFTSTVLKSHFKERSLFLSESVEDLKKQLEKALENNEHLKNKTALDTSYGVFFSPHANDIHGIGKACYDVLPSFKEVLDRCNSEFLNYSTISLYDYLWTSNSEKKDDLDELADFCLSYAFGTTLLTWIETPAYLVGHGLGELVAACTAGVVTVKEALLIIHSRWETLKNVTAEGGMLLVYAREEEIAHYMPQGTSIAVYNGDENLVVSGPLSGVREFEEQLNKNNIPCFFLEGAKATHSVIMDAILDEFRDKIKTVHPKPPQLPIVSTLTGEVVNNTFGTPEYWVDCLRQPVQFKQAINTLTAKGIKQFLEIGIRPVADQLGSISCNWSLDLNKAHEWKSVLLFLKEVYESGFEVKWKELFPVAQNLVQLPTYAFHKKNYWNKSIPSFNQTKPSTENLATTVEPAHLPSSNLEEIKQKVKSIVAQLVKLEAHELLDTTPLLQVGMDSMMIVALIKQIKELYGTKLSVRQIFEDCNHIQAISVFISENSTLEASVVVADSAPKVVPVSEVVQTKVVTNETTAATIEAGVREIVSTTLNLADGELSSTTTLLELGADSMMIVSIIKQIQEQFELKLTVRQLFEEVNTVKAITDSIKESGYKAAASPVGEPVKEETPTPVIREKKVFSEQSNSKVSAINDDYWEKETPQKKSLSPEKSKYLESFIQQYNQKTSQSKETARLDRKTLCNNRRSSSGFRYETKELLYPIIAQSSRGSRFTDLDGNEYIDLAMGYGVNLFGHNPDFLKEAQAAQLEKGIQVGPESDLVGEVSRKLNELTGFDRSLYCNSGSEAVMTALRVARAATKRRKVALFSNSYHGHFDGTMVLSQEGKTIPMVMGTTESMVEDVIVLPYDNDQAFSIIEQHAHELAAVMIEPVQNRRPDLHPKSFLQQLRAITQQNKILLIFDEILVGFRVNQKGAMAHFGIEPDMATYGKVIGGGMPIGIVAGSKFCMDTVDGGDWNYHDESYPKVATTYTAGTFCKHPLAMVSANAILGKLLEEGPSLQEKLNENTAYLAREVNNYFQERQVPIQMVNFGSFFRFSSQGNLSFVYQPLELDLFFYQLIHKGIYVWEGKTCFLSTAHTQQDIETIIKAAKEAVDELIQAGFWSGAKKAVAPAVTPATPSFRFDENAPALKQQLPFGKSTEKDLDFSFYFFGDYQAEFNQNKYDLLFDGVKFAEQNDFHAIWLPERHFDSFGGFSPNPSVLSAAISRETQNLKLRSSVVLPIHNPIRVAEEWSMVDNLSRGRIGLAFASGWHPDDFVFFPEAWGKNKEVMFDNIEVVQRLWQGQHMFGTGGKGKTTKVELYPLPMQEELPVWVTSLGNPETYRKAGEIGAGIVTNMIGQEVEDVQKNIAIYREALQKNGFDPEKGHVVVLMHTLVGENKDEIREMAKEPFCNYLSASIGLFQKMVSSEGLQVDFNKLTEEDKRFMLEKAFYNYVEKNALVGSPESCKPIVQKLKDVGVDEIACFVDFGVQPDIVTANFKYLNELKKAFDDTTPDPKHYKSMAPIVEPEARVSNHKSAVAERKTEVATTGDQQLLSLISKMEKGGSVAYNSSNTLLFKGKVDVEALKLAIDKTTQRHQALRMVISSDSKTQYELPEYSPEVEMIDFSSLSDNEKEEKTKAFFNEEKQKAFEFSKPLGRYYLIKKSEQEYLFVTTFHHIFCDGVSVGVILQDIEAFYSAAVNRQPDPVLPEAMDFTAFVQERENWLKSQACEEQKQYWVNKVKNGYPELNLPTDFVRPAVKSFNGERINFKISEATYNKLKTYSQTKRVSYFMTLLSVYHMMLHKYANQERITVGIAFAARNSQGSDAMVGYASNIFPITSELKASDRPEDYMSNLKQELLDAYDYQEYPLAELIKETKIKRDPSKTPFYSVAFNWDKIEIPAFSGLDVTYYPQPVAFVEYDLMPNVMEVNGELVVSWDYNTDLFEAETVRKMTVHFQKLLDQVLTDSEAPCVALTMLSDEEEAKIDVILSGSKADFGNDSVVQLVEKAVVASPNKIALQFKKDKLSYSKFNKLANKTAHWLHEKGIQPNDRVALTLSPSLEMYVSMLAILKTGAHFVPINPLHPVAKIQQIIEDASPKLVFTDGERSELKEAIAEVVLLENVEKERKNHSDKNLSVDIPSESNVYVIYTSGSTGKSKGVPITHSNLSNMIFALNEKFNLSASDSILTVANYSFDLSVPDWSMSFALGAKLVISDEEDRYKPEALMQLMKEQKTTFMQATPTTWNMLLNKGWQDTSKQMQIVCGGEAFPIDLAKKLVDNASTVWNAYGPTENTVWTTVFALDEAVKERSFVPLGSPLTNVALRVVDQYMQQVPVGINGELLIHGKNLSAGYLNREELTQKAFIQLGDKTFYRTGDLVKLNKNNELEFVGRIDTQVKVRGFRLELGEIESALVKMDLVEEAVVNLNQDGTGEPQLVAYVKGAQLTEGHQAELLSALKDVLPQYMIPSAFVQMDEWPLNANRKIDRKQLPAPVSKTATKKVEPLQNSDDSEITQKLKSIWSEVLEHQDFTVDDDFFLAGGTSLLLPELQNKIKMGFGLDIPITKLFLFSSIILLEKYIDKQLLASTELI